MASLTVSAGAIDIYSTTPEVEPLLKSSALMSTYDSGISIAAVEPSDLDDYLNSSGSYLTNNGTITGGAYSPTNSVADLIRHGFSGLHYNVIDVRDTLHQLLRGDGDIPNGVGGTISGTNVSLWKLVNKGFQGVTYVLRDIEDLVTNIPNYTSKLNDVITSLSLVRTAVNNVVSGLSTVNTSVGNVNTSVGTVNTSVNSVNSTLLTQLLAPNGAYTLGSNGNVITLSDNLDFQALIRNGFLGIASHLRIPYNSNYLNSAGNVVVNNNTSGLPFEHIVRGGFLGIRNYLDAEIAPVDGWYALDTSGVTTTVTSSWNFVRLLSYGLRGISANIKGSESDNIYTSTLNDNNNTTTTVNSTGLGPLLNTQLSNIGENLGHLAYVFASDEDIKLREDSQPLLDTTDSFYDDSDSNVKISTNNVGSLKDIAGNFTSIIDADADIGDAFAIVSNDNTYRWFSADVAMNLDSLGVATVDFDESTYDRLHREFNEIYFPDRVGGGN